MSAHTAYRTDAKRARVPFLDIHFSANKTTQDMRTEEFHKSQNGTYAFKSICLEERTYTAYYLSQAEGNAIYEVLL